MNLKVFSYCETSGIKAWYACSPQVQKPVGKNRALRGNSCSYSTLKQTMEKEQSFLFDETFGNVAYPMQTDAAMTLINCKH